MRAITDWIARSRPDDLLSVDIFFDMRGVYGQLGLADTLWRCAFDAARGRVEFAKLLAEVGRPVERGIGFFGRIRARKGRIDLKRAGLFGIVSTARVLSIQHHVLERSTPARLRGVRALDVGGEADIDRADRGAGDVSGIGPVAAARRYPCRARPATNTVVGQAAVRRANAERLQAALQSVRHLDELTRELLFKD